MKLTLENLKTTSLTKKYRDLTVELSHCSKLNRIYYCILTSDNKKYQNGFSLNFKDTIEFYIKRFGEENWESTDKKVRFTTYIDLEHWTDEKYRVNNYTCKHPSDNNITAEELIKGRVL